MPYSCNTCDGKFRYKISLRTHKCTGFVSPVITENNLQQTQAAAVAATVSTSSLNRSDDDTMVESKTDQETVPCMEQTLDEFITESCNRMGIVDHNESDHHSRVAATMYACENTENGINTIQSTTFDCDSFNLHDLSFCDGVDGETTTTDTADDLANVTPSMSEIFPQTMDILNALYDNVITESAAAAADHNHHQQFL